MTLSILVERKYILFLFCWLCCGIEVGAYAQEKHDGITSHTKYGSDYSSYSKTAVKDYIGLYQKYISGARGSNCPMYPSCSNYGLMVFNDKPFYEAIALTADRLVRCSHDRKYYDETYEYGHSSLLDLPPYMKVPRDLIYTPKRYFYTDNIKGKNRKDSANLFINYLINDGNYVAALLEIDRTLYFNRTTDPSVYVNKLICYEALDKEEEGIYDYKVKFPYSIQNNSKVMLKVSKLYFNIENNEEALNKLNDLEKNTQDSSILYKKYVLQGVVEAKEEHYQKAKDAFIYSSHYSPYGADLLAKNLQITDDLLHYKKKSPGLARLLSIVPGGGYLYTHHTQNAITSFVINSLLAYATYTSIKSKNYGVAGLMGTLSFSFYCGNILGAGNSAKKYNQYHKGKKIHKLINQNQIINY